jgi:Flp pilus assembly pilin Flp
MSFLKAAAAGSENRSKARLTAVFVGGKPVLDAFDNQRARRHYWVHDWPKNFRHSEGNMFQFFRGVWCDEQGQDIAEYAVMLAVILVLVIGTVRLIGTNANTAFSSVANALQTNQ